MIAKLKELLQGDFIRFVLVGVVNTVIGLGVTFICLNLLEAGYWASTLIGNAVGAVNSFFMNKSFTFRSKASVKQTAWKFLLVTAVCYFAAYYLAALATHRVVDLLFSSAGTKLKDNIAALIGSGLYTVLNYFGQKKITFMDKADSDKPEAQISASRLHIPEREESSK